MPVGQKTAKTQKGSGYNKKSKKWILKRSLQRNLQENYKRKLINKLVDEDHQITKHDKYYN